MNPLQLLFIYVANFPINTIPSPVTSYSLWKWKVPFRAKTYHYHQLCGPQANDTEICAALFTKKGEGGTLEVYCLNTDIGKLEGSLHQTRCICFNHYAYYFYARRVLRCILDFERSGDRRHGSEIFLGKWTLWAGSFRCLPHQWHFYWDTCRNRTDNPCVTSPHV